MTVRDLLTARAETDRPGLRFEDREWSWRDVAAESAARSAALAELLDPERPPHVAVLLDNVPEFAFTLGGAALGGHVVVGLNSTRRGPALAADLAHTDGQFVLTHAGLRDLLPSDLDVPVYDVDGTEWRELLDKHRGAPIAERDVGPDDLLMLIFTSGTSGDPKAVRVTHTKVAYPGVMLAERFGLGQDDVVYLAMPMFHSNAIMAGWAVGLAAGATIALERKFSASGFLPAVRRFGATYANYVGKPLAYVLATPEQPDDADNPLRIVFGNEANERDIAEFARRFGCTVVDSYGSTENAVIVQRQPDMPPGSLGWPVDGVKVLRPDGTETP
ncbi:MAG TPA: AMP-binding protein, partial [Aeromicrobium sp.]